MYADTILFIISAIGLLALIISIIYLIGSSKNSKTFKRNIQDETEYNMLKNTNLVNTNITVDNDVNEDNKTGTIDPGEGNNTSAPDNTAVLNNNYEHYTVMPNIDKTDKTDKTDMLAQKTEIESEMTALLDSKETEYLQADADAEQKDAAQMKFLEGLYVIEKTIYSGPMSKVFIARGVKLDNKCIIKFVTHEIGNLSYEHDKLKNLHHIHLPRIMDIFTDADGIYLVESYIEGKNLSDIIKEVAESKRVFNQYLIMDWAKQLCGVYSYLHNLPDSPIYHFDIKPANIMVTHGDNLVPIDFGISKRANDASKTIAGVSPKYGAPEQFGNTSNPSHRKIMNYRFGKLPEDFINWEPDARTDIFSLGTVLFELATGDIPSAENLSMVKNAVSAEFAKIILKCIKINPAERYQTMDEILIDLQKLNTVIVKIHKSMLMRRIIAVIAVLAFILSSGGFTWGGYIYQQEALSVLGIEPQLVTISLQSSSELKIEKFMPNGSIVDLEPSDLIWLTGSDNIAQIDGNRIMGLNLGKTTIQGRHRNKLVEFAVNVVEPMDGMVEIVQIYERGHKVALFGGTLERDHIDGLLGGEAEFVSPESIDIADNGTIYIADSGVLRKIKDNAVESIDIDLFYMTPAIIRCHKNDVYVLTNEWEEMDGSYNYGIIRVRDDGAAEEIYITDAVYTAIEDFGFSPAGDHLLYYIERNAGTGEVYLKTINLQNPNDMNDINSICKLPQGTRSLAFGEDNTIYLSNPETGIIQYYKDGELKYFAGVENEKAFIDGSAPLFYMPQRIKYAGNLLYVWDFNVLRKITIENGAAVDCMTLAGEASPEFDLENIEKEYDAENVVLANSYLMDFAVTDGGILLNDPKRGVIWKVD